MRDVTQWSARTRWELRFICIRSGVGCRILMGLKWVGYTHSVLLLLLLLGSFNFIIQIVLRIIRALCTMQTCEVQNHIMHFKEKQFQYLPHFYVIADNTCAHAVRVSFLHIACAIIAFRRNNSGERNWVLFIAKLYFIFRFQRHISRLMIQKQIHIEN